MTELETLLRRYAEGDISQEELQMLDTLSHREEVVAGAVIRAKSLRRQRATKMSVAASLAVVVAVVVAVALRAGGLPGVSDTAMEASVAPQPALVAPSPVVGEPAEMPTPVLGKDHQVSRHEVAESHPAALKGMPEAAAKTEEGPRQPAKLHEEAPAPPYAGEGYPVVACNSECSPDSVINDIWRFLRV